MAFLCYDDGVDEYNEDDQSPGLGEADLFDLITELVTFGFWSGGKTVNYQGSSVKVATE